MKNVLATIGGILAILTFMLSPFFADAQVIPSIPYNLTNGSLADATQVMGNFNTIVTDVNANAANNGTNTNITSLTGLTTPIPNNFGGTVIYTGGTTGGSGNAQTLTTVVPASFSLTAGNMVTGIAGFTNTGATTLSVAGGAATTVDKLTTSGLTALTGGEIVTGQLVYFYYDGTQFELINSPPTNVANSQLSLMSADTIKGNSTAGNHVPIDLSIAQVQQLTSAFVTVHQQSITSSGTYTPCTGLVYNVVTLVAAGGNGGSGGSTTTGTGGGGGGGECRIGTFSASTIGASQTVTLGAVGNNSTFGSLLTAVFGGNGATAQSTASNGAVGGGGGSGGSGGYGIPGQAGNQGAGSGGNGAGGSNNISGQGGNTCLGFGAQGVVSGNGVSANANSGGGGSGGVANPNSGGAGGTGRVIITEYCDQ